MTTPPGYADFAGRDEKNTFQDVKLHTSRFAHALRQLGVKKGDRVGTFLPRTPELYIAILGINRLGAIPVPLFEAFMEQAVEDRLGDSEAGACVTSLALKSRLPPARLPALKTLVLVGAGKTLAPNEASYERLMAGAPDWVEPGWVTGGDGGPIPHTPRPTGEAQGGAHPP